MVLRGANIICYAPGSWRNPYNNANASKPKHQTARFASPPVYNSCMDGGQNSRGAVVGWHTHIHTHANTAKLKEWKHMGIGKVLCIHTHTQTDIHSGTQLGTHTHTEISDRSPWHALRARIPGTRSNHTSWARTRGKRSGRTLKARTTGTPSWHALGSHSLCMRSGHTLRECNRGTHSGHALRARGPGTRSGRALQECSSAKESPLEARISTNMRPTNAPC